MMELMCHGCGREGRIPDRHAGMKLICKACRAVNTAPAPVTREVEVPDWILAIDAASESVTVEVEVRDWTTGVIAV